MRGFCSHLEGPRQAGELVWWEPREVQQRQMSSPAPGEELFRIPECAAGQLAGNQLCRGGPEGPSGHQVEYDHQQ